jgi:hypothetical protein
MLIEDGTGNGYKAQVDDENRIRTLSHNVSFASHVSADEGKYYSWNFVSADLATAETVLMVCNNSTSESLLIDWIYIWGDAPCAYDIHFPAYATWAGTAVTGVNWNASSGNSAEATAIGDETGQATQGSILTTVMSNELTGDQFGIQLDISGKIVLGYHDAIAIDVVGAPAANECTIAGYFHA